MIKELVVGIIFGVLAGMGIGGGGLPVVYLTAFEGLAQREGQGVNLFLFMFAGGASLLFHMRHRRINLPFLFVVATVGVGAAVFGARLSGMADPGLMRKAFGVMLVGAGLLSLGKNVFRRKNN